MLIVGRSIGTKTVENLKRLFLRKTSFLKTKNIAFDVGVPDVTLFSLANSLRLKPGRLERESNVFKYSAHKAELKQQVICEDQVLFTGQREHRNPPVAIIDGLKTPDPSVMDGTLDCHPITSSQVLFAMRNCAKIRLEDLRLPCNVPLPVCDTVLNRQHFAVLSPRIRIDTPAVLRRTTTRQIFGNAQVMSVPEPIELRVPLIRKRVLMESLNDPFNVTHFSVEKKLLAAAVGNDAIDSDIQIIGVFRHVPVSSVRRIEIGPGATSLSIFLRPKCGNMVQSANRPMFSIAFGRSKGKKEIVRVLVPE